MPWGWVGGWKLPRRGDMNTTLKLDLWWVIRQVRKNLGGGMAKGGTFQEKGDKG